MPILDPRQPGTIKPYGEFVPEDFRRMLAERGLPTTWEESVRCPCAIRVQNVTLDLDFGDPTAASSGITGESRADCPRCHGAGYFLRNPQTITALFQDQSATNARFGPVGQMPLSSGSARVTLFPENKPALGDRLTLQNSVIRLRESKFRGPGVTDTLRFPVVGQTQDLAGGPVVIRTWGGQRAGIDGTTSATVDSLLEGTDYTIVAGQINWTLGDALGSAPVAGAQYDITYFARPRYVVMNFSHGVRDGIQRMGHGGAPPVQYPISVSANAEYMGLNSGVAQ